MARRTRVVLTSMPDDAAGPLADYLDRRGYEVRTATEDWEIAPLLIGTEADVVLLGPRLDAASAFELLRGRPPGGLPQLILIRPNGDVVERIVALELGAADVVEDSAVPREIAARIARLVTRSAQAGTGSGAPQLVRLDQATIDLRAALVMHESGDEEDLSPGQVALIKLFFENPRKVLTREDIIDAAPAESAEAFDRSIDSRIVRLRRKLRTDRIATIRGTGYRFDPPLGWIL